MTSIDLPMLVRLPNHRTHTAVLLERPLDPSTWAALPNNVGAAPHRGRAALDAILSGLAEQDAQRRVYIQHRMDHLGRHEYIDLHALAQQSLPRAGDSLAPLPVVTEELVKPKIADGSALVLVAQAAQVQAPLASTSVQTAEDARLCPPMSLYANYSVCEELTLGRTQRVMLADESTLARGGAAMPPIFNHLSLIVNCHQDESAAHAGKYRLGSAQFAVIFEPVHKLYGSQQDVVVQTLLSIVQRMWQALQTGSIAVHCLAGLHRAPAVLACFYLYRYHVLGHLYLPGEVSDIYARMRAVRPAVAPLGYISLIRHFEAHLLQARAPNAGQSRPAGR